MAKTTTFGMVETAVRRDIVNDNDPDQYRWSSFQVFGAINNALSELVTSVNVWIGYDPVTGMRLGNPRNALVETTCRADVATLAGYGASTTFTDPAPTGSESASITGVDALLTRIRGKVIPVDDRYADAVACLAAAWLLETDNSDTANAQKAAYLIGKARQYAKMSNLAAVATGSLAGGGQG